MYCPTSKISLPCVTIASSQYTEWNWPNSNPRMHLFHIPQCSFKSKCAHFCSEWSIMHISVLTGPLWDMENVHYRICEIVLLIATPQLIRKQSNWGANSTSEHSQIARFMGPTWDPLGSCLPQVGSILAPWTLLSGLPSGHHLSAYLFTLWSKCIKCIKCMSCRNVEILIRVKNNHLINRVSHQLLCKID